MTEVVMNPKHAAEAARAVENSPAARAKQLLTSPAPSAYTLTPDPLTAEFKPIKDGQQKLSDKCSEWMGAIKDAVYSPGADDDQQFEKLLAAVKVKPLPIVKAIVDWHVDALALAQRHVDALQPIPDQLDREAKQVVETVKSDLERIGSGVNSMLPNADDQPEAASKRFDFVARQNSRSRAAIQKAEQARAEYSAAVETVKQLTGRLDEARNLLRSVAVSAVTSAA